MLVRAHDYTQERDERKILEGICAPSVAQDRGCEKIAMAVRGQA